MSKRVTIKSIAEDLGISHMTVSRALSDHPNVQQKTREAILQRAKELGYVKSAAAKAIRGERTNIIGLLLPNIVNDFYARFANTLAVACESRSYQLIIHLTNDDINVENQAIQRLRELQAFAVVMVPSPGNLKDHTLQFDAMKVVQLIRQRKMEKPSSSVLVRDSAALSKAVCWLASQGHQEIAYVGANSALSSGRSRLKAFRAGLKKANLTENTGLIHTEKPSFSLGYESAQKIIAGKEASAVVCGGFEISNGVLSAIMQHKLKPGSDFAFIGYGDPHFYSWINAGISTIQIPVERLAHRAVELLTDDNSPSDRDRKVSVKAELIIRGK